MAVIVTDRRTLIDEADSTTGWTSDLSPAVFTTEPDPIESTGCLGIVVSKVSGYLYHTHGSNIDCDSNVSEGGKTFDGKLVYVWVFQRGAPQPTATGGLGIVIGDGTNTTGYYLAGSDKKTFTHDTGGPYFQCMVLDTSNLPANKHDIAGTEASMNLSTITQFGGTCNNGAAKAVGGVANYFWDVVRVGNLGLRVTGGEPVSNVGTFSDIVTEDSSTANNKALGIIREFSTGIFGVQGGLTFGDTLDSTNTHFEDEGVVVAFESAPVGNDKFFIDIEGNDGANNVFILRDSTIKSAGPHVALDFTASANGDVDELTLDTVSFADLIKPIYFSNKTDAAGHNVTGCTFFNCGQIDPGDVSFTFNTISSSANTTGAILLDADGTTNWSDLTFSSNGTGHAIYIPSGATGTYTLTNIEYNGYAAANGTTGNEVVYNDSGGAVTLTISGGDTPSIRNGSGASTTVNNTKRVTLTGLKDNTEVRVFETGTTTELHGTENATTGTTDNRSYFFDEAAGANVDIRIINKTYEYISLEDYVVPNQNAEIPIQQRFDRNFDNP